MSIIVGGHYLGLPDLLPRSETVLPAGEACAACGGKLKPVGEDVTEELEYVPGRFVVNRIIRPRMDYHGRGTFRLHETARGGNIECRLVPRGFFVGGTG